MSDVFIIIYYHQFHLVLIDYKMPQITGCELANKITDINSRIEMVLITSANDIVNNNLNLELFLKPLRMHQLLDIVAKYVS
jgi:two-component SAPR family response regulator